MQLGINSVLFGGHDLESAFKYARRAGYDGIELAAIPPMADHLDLDRWQDQAEDIRNLSRTYELPLLAMEQPSQEPEVMEKAMQAAAEIGVPIVNCGPGGEADNEEH